MWWRKLIKIKGNCQPPRPAVYCNINFRIKFILKWILLSDSIFFKYCSSPVNTWRQFQADYFRNWRRALFFQIFGNVSNALFWSFHYCIKRNHLCHPIFHSGSINIESRIEIIRNGQVNSETIGNLKLAPSFGCVASDAGRFHTDFNGWMGINDYAQYPSIDIPMPNIWQLPPASLLTQRRFSLSPR